nr:Chain P, HCMV pp65 fragment 495-503, variant M5S (NLVPSVATV) [synthetic construct]
NLVPSVATV